MRRFLHSSGMPIEIDLAHVARLARLDLDPDELDAYRAQLLVILEHAARVQTLDGGEEAEGTHPLGLSNALRRDEVGESLVREEILAQAPDASGGYYVVPPSLEVE